MLMKAINAIHLPTYVLAFIAVVVSQFVILFNGNPIDLTTNEGRINLSVALVGMLLAALQKAVPAAKV
jgi:hypothetical protein